MPVLSGNYDLNAARLLSTLRPAGREGLQMSGRLGKYRTKAGKQLWRYTVELPRRMSKDGHIGRASARGTVPVVDAADDTKPKITSCYRPHGPS